MFIKIDNLHFNVNHIIVMDELQDDPDGYATLIITNITHYYTKTKIENILAAYSYALEKFGNSVATPFKDQIPNQNIAKKTLINEG